MAVVDDMGGSGGAGGGDGVPLTLFDKRSSGRHAMLLMDEFGVVEPCCEAEECEAAEAACEWCKFDPIKREPGQPGI